MSALRIEAIRLLCPDPAATAHFYATALGCAVTQAGPSHVVAIGGQRIELVPTSTARGAPAPSNATTFQHCAIIVADMEAAMACLSQATGWTAISRAGPERLPQSSGGVTAFKFRDPDGHPLEFLQFPAAAIPPAWQRLDGLMLGIDHTAITVTDTERSIAFYARLGFTVGNRGVNRGIEQARMDDIDAPLVEVTGLMPPGGAPPHLELLCYRDPGPLARTTAPDDVLATRVILTGVADMAAFADPDGHRFDIV